MGNFAALNEIRNVLSESGSIERKEPRDGYQGHRRESEKDKM